MKAGFIPAFSPSVKLQVLLHETFYAINLAGQLSLCSGAKPVALKKAVAGQMTTAQL